MLNYFAQLRPGKIVLWCYLLWYLVTLAFYFDPTPRIWINSLGISGIIGCALLLSVSGGAATKVDHWQTFRLFLMPFGVSSFSSLIKDQGFFLILPPKLEQLAVYVASCLAFLAFVTALKKWSSRSLLRAPQVTLR
jgi:hypothetical protein